jgi:hypothetical protein
MLHPMAWGKEEDTLGNHESHNKYASSLSSNLVKLTSERTKIPQKRLKRLSTIETQYFVGEELFTNGIATDILETASFWYVEKPEKSEDTEKAPQKIIVLNEERN